MLRKTGLFFTLATALFTPVAIELAHAGAADDITPPPVPSNLEAPAGQRPYLIGHAYGTQNYICLPTVSGAAWTFLGPQATLFDKDGEQLTTHFLSPNPVENGTPRATWQHSQDTSTVWAAAVASSTDPAYVAPGAIPWLLLQVVGRERGPTGGATLLKTRFIQRLNTAGGSAPATGCSQSMHIGQRVCVPYTADFFFYRATQGHEREDEE